MRKGLSSRVNRNTSPCNSCLCLCVAQCYWSLNLYLSANLFCCTAASYMSHTHTHIGDHVAHTVRRTRTHTHTPRRAAVSIITRARVTVIELLFFRRLSGPLRKQVADKGVGCWRRFTGCLRLFTGCLTPFAHKFTDIPFDR